jgi:hypothetical protein
MLNKLTIVDNFTFSTLLDMVYSCVCDAVIIRTI